MVKAAQQTGCIQQMFLHWNRVMDAYGAGSNLWVPVVCYGAALLRCNMCFFCLGHCYVRVTFHEEQPSSVAVHRTILALHGPCTATYDNCEAHDQILTPKHQMFMMLQARGLYSLYHSVVLYSDCTVTLMMTMIMYSHTAR
jgi:hypothetical protein